MALVIWFNACVGKIPWRRKWQPTPVFLPGKSMDRGAWRATVHEVTKDSDTSERTHKIHFFSTDKKNSIAQMYHIQFPVNEYWYWVYIFAIMSNTAMSFTHLLVHVYKHLPSLVYIQRNGTADIPVADNKAKLSSKIFMSVYTLTKTLEVSWIYILRILSIRP